MATNNIIHGDYVETPDGRGFVVQIRTEFGKPVEYQVNLDGQRDLVWFGADNDIERVGHALNENMERLADALRDQAFEVGDQVEIVKDLTGGMPQAIGLRGEVVATGGEREWPGGISLSVRVLDEYGKVWDCNPAELRNLTELEIDQVAISGAFQAMLRRAVEAPVETGEDGYYDRFEDIAQELIDTHNRKGADYGVTEDPYANVRSATDYGLPAWVGVAIRMQDKMRRIQAASRQWGETGEVSLANESLEDAFLDAAVYGIIGLIMLRDEAEGTSP